MEEAIRFVNVFSAAIAAGGTVIVLGVLLPALRQLPEREAVRVHQLVTPLFYRYQPVATAVSLVAAVVLLAVDLDITKVQWLATLAGLVCSAGVAGVSFRVNMPLNSVIAAWSADAVPPEYPAIRARWNRGHLVRTTFAVAALALYLVAALAD